MNIDRLNNLFVANSYDINTLIRKYKLTGNLDVSEINILIDYCSEMLLNYDQDRYQELIRVICYLCELNVDNQSIKYAIDELIKDTRLYVFESMRYSTSETIDWFDVLPRGIYTRKSGVVLTKDQLSILEAYSTNRRLVVSAPTSFGKTMIASEIIREYSYKKIVLVFPVIALLYEMTAKLKGFSEQGYKIITSVKQFEECNFEADHFICILTPERCLNLIEETNALHYIDFFMIDEIYKIDNRFVNEVEDSVYIDEREKVFRYILYRLSKTSADCYLAGPYFNDFPKKIVPYGDNEQLKFLQIKTDLVQKNIYNFTEVEIGKNLIFSGINVKRYSPSTNAGNIRTVRDLLKAVNGKTIVYTNKKTSAKSIIKNLIGDFEKHEDYDFINFIKKIIPEDSTIVQGLERGIAIHHGSLPRFLQNEILDVFNSDTLYITTIVSTTTITEGVNTTAKNVIVFDLRKGNENLTYFDYLNIVGRSGRLGHYFIGNVFLILGKIQENTEDLKVEITYLEDKQELDKSEILAYDKDDLTQKNKVILSEIELYLNQRDIDIFSLKNNKLVSYERQLALIYELKNINIRYLDYIYNKRIDISEEIVFSLDNLADFANYFRFGRKENDTNTDDERTRNLVKRTSTRLLFCIIYSTLFSDSEKKSVQGHDNFEFRNRLVKSAMYYLSSYVDMKVLFSMQNSNDVDTRVNRGFEIVRNYFEFIFPKYLSVFEQIFNMLEKDNEISLKLLSTKLEYGFYHSHEILLRESGIPSYFIARIAGFFESIEYMSDIKRIYTLNKIDISNVLDSYELSVLEKYII